MSKTTKSPLTLAKTAYAAGQKALPRYAHKFSRRDFTCAQLFAILALRKFFKTDYRGIIQILYEWPQLRETLELHDKVPHFTTPQKAAAKLFDDTLIRQLLTQTLRQFYRHGEIDDDDIAFAQRIDLAAADSTGFASQHCSAYFTKRRKQGKNKDDDDPVSYHHYPKFALVTDCENHLILSTLPKQGPATDVAELLPLMDRMCPNVVFDTLLADAGYDSEQNHVMLREYLEIESIIPPRLGRPTHQLPTGKWRWLMATAFDEEIYNQRWQVETVMFMLKARQGAELTARSDRARCGEMNLMAVVHNLMILLRRAGELFYTAGSNPFKGCISSPLCFGLTSL